MYGTANVRYGTVRVRQNFKSTVRYGTAKTAYGRTLECTLFERNNPKRKGVIPFEFSRHFQRSDVMTSPCLHVSSAQ